MHEIESVVLKSTGAWHGLGTVVKGIMSAQECIQKAGLDWSVSTQKIITETDIEIEEARAIVRDSDQSILGVVGSTYKPLQNSEAFDFFNPFVEAKECQFETAGSLRKGRRIWILAKLKKAPVEIVKNDAIEKYLLLSNSHDGTMAVRVSFTPIRVVCANTLAMAHNNANSQFIRITHGKKVLENLQAIREITSAADGKFEVTAEKYKFLASKQINSKDLKKYVEIILGKPAGDERANIASNKINERIEQLFTQSPGADIPHVGGTYWAAYNAINYYLNYDIGKDQDRRVNELWFGHLNRINQAAFQYAMEA